MYDRLVIKAIGSLCEESRRRCDVLILNDEPRDIDWRYLKGVSSVRVFRGSKVRFCNEFIRGAIANRPRVILFGHVHFAPLALLTRVVSPRARSWFLVYGVDFWRRLSSIARFVVRRADKILSISDYTRRVGAAANSLPDSNIDLLPCALDPYWEAEHRSTATRSEIPMEPVLLTVARLASSERYKGIEEVIRVIPSVRREHPRIKYRIVGDGDDRPRLQRIAEDLGLSDAVTFLGRVSPAQLADEYSACSLFVMPSEKEGFGIVFLEAASFRKPSVGAPSGGIPEVIEDGETGVLLSRDDPGRLASGICDLLSDRPQLERLGRAAAERLRRFFTYDAFLAKTRELLEESLGT